MESGKGRSPARRGALAIAVTCAVFGVGASQAAAATLKPAAPLAGFHVAFGCANPANHGRTGDVLGAAHVAVGNGLRCFSQALAHGRGLGPQVMAGPTGLGPSQIQSAYKLAGLKSAGKTVAVVDAFDDPKAATDLNKFRSTYGLPACTTANGCFKKESQTGSTTRHKRLERDLLAVVPVHRRSGLRRSDRARHPERRGRLLAGIAAALGSLPLERGRAPRHARIGR